MRNSKTEGAEGHSIENGQRRPDVSFIMPAHNVARYVHAAVTSVLEQTGVDVEVILVDDASMDDTARIVQKLAEGDARITLVRMTKNAGASVARNIALERARGRWLAFVDSDDLIVPERSRRLIDLAETSGADVVADNFERFNDKGTIRSVMIPEASHPYAFFVNAATFMRRNAMFDKRANLGYIKAMFRANFIKEHRIRHQEEIYIGEDYHFCLSCMLADARFIVTSESFYKYRVRDGSLSWRLAASDIERLLSAHAALGIEPGRHGTEMHEAAIVYARSLRTALRVTTTLDEARAGRWRSALALAGRNPRGWGLLARFAGEAAGKRLMSS